MYNKWIFSAAILCCFGLLTGCSFAVPPVDLLRAPSVTADLQEMRLAVLEQLPAGAKLTLPAHFPKGTAAISEVDLDGDGLNEAIAFYKKEMNQFELGAVILSKKSGTWEKIAEIQELGSAVHYLDFQDVTGNGVQDMLVGWSGGEEVKKELTVYSFPDGKIREIGRNSYSELVVGDLNNDQVSEVVLIQLDRNESIAKAELYHYLEGKLRPADRIALDGTINGYTQILLGNATESRKGVFIDAGVGAHSSTTTLLVMEEGRLRDVFGGAKAKDGGGIYNPYTVMSEDINQDGIIEIDLMRQPPGTEELPMVAVPWIHSWHQWDGLDGLKRVHDNFYDFSAGFRFDFPDGWHDRITITKEEDASSGSFLFEYVGEDRKYKQELLTLAYFPRDDKQEKERDRKDKQSEIVPLGERNEKTFIALLPTEHPKLPEQAAKEYEKLRIDPQQIRDLFHFVH
ncbi:VCBS repeat-containing protein [Paenibacillus sp. J2TS4]|uniref:VCBS repeat-containing protein n=1 Tax=Paenibacillus sp. J2TS4 TaxID=2807194 RepID=UPI001B192CAE|nr:VCBS repeat-containing protein [Paenibacillus sp. J2TS4]GIP34425.1 hypothetical protein J2TS4_36350 [Paenibacillus sp. J2TS4]